MTFRFGCLVVTFAFLAGCGGGGGTDVGELDAFVSADVGVSVDAAGTDAGEPGDAFTAPDASAPTTCPLALACDTTPPAAGPTSDWRHSVASGFTVLQGSARHRGRDLILREGDPQWALAKFAYGAADDDLKDEDVTLLLLRDCGDTWETLGTATTTNDGDHATIEGVEDTGGRVFFEIPDAMRLGLGRHRIHFVVNGDHTTTDQYIEVLPADARFVVTDVDGTQTESENAEFTAVLGGADPANNPYGPELMTAFAHRGYHVFYLTARPEWLHSRTHEWLAVHGYPPGIVHTTLSGLGATGDAAITFKTDELEVLLGRFPGALDDTIGNTDTDAAAFANVGIPPDHSFLYQFDPGDIGTRVDDYSTLIPGVEAREALCR